MIKLLIFQYIHVFLSNGYILGETEGDKNFLRCWQNGNLMSQCPIGLTWSWNLSTSETWYENEQYFLRLNMTWSDTFKSVITTKDNSSSFLVDHINVHSCKFSFGSVCTPSATALGDAITHTSVITSNTDGLFISSVSLTQGSWNVIAHGRIYLNDTTHYQLEGDTCTCQSNLTSTVTSPWKLDFAIGSPHDVEAPLTTNTGSTTNIAGWQILIMAIIILGVIIAGYKFYKQYKKRKIDADAMEEKESPEIQLKKSMIFEITSLSVSLAIGTFDWITDTMALISIQSTENLSQSLVISYFFIVIIITIFYFYVLYLGVVDILGVINEYRNGINEVITVRESLRSNNDSEVWYNDNHIIRMKGVSFRHSVTESDLENKKVERVGNINYEYSSVRRSIRNEQTGFLMAGLQDVPMFIFNAILLFHYDVGSGEVMISFIANTMILGYKFSGVERLWYLMQLRTKIDSMVSAVRLSRSLTENDVCVSNQIKHGLFSIEQSLINDNIVVNNPSLNNESINSNTSRESETDGV